MGVRLTVTVETDEVEAVFAEIAARVARHAPRCRRAQGMFTELVAA